MMVKSALDFFILKFYLPLQSYLLTCQADSAFLDRFFLHWAVATLKQHHHFLSQNFGFKTGDSSPLILGVLGGVASPNTYTVHAPL